MLRNVAQRFAQRAAVARVAPRRLMSAEAEQYQALTGNKSFVGTAMEQPEGSCTRECFSRTDS